MPLELTEQQRMALANRPHGPIEMIDPVTRRQYVLIAAEEFQRAAGAFSPEAQPPNPVPDAVPPGISKSQAALRCDLPALLASKTLYHGWVAYHGDEQIGVARTKIALIAECRRRGLSHDQYYVAWIDESELIEEEDVQFSLAEFDDDPEPATP